MSPYGWAKMKTTIEISDPLLQQARRLAQREGVTLRALVERGLNHVVGEASAPTRRFRLRDAAFEGEGLQAAFEGVPFERVLSEIYQDRGG